jgi:lipopolysaccharide transport system permease protein
MDQSIEIPPAHTIIDARSRLKLVDWQEIRNYRDLFYFLVWREVKSRYAQSVLGIGWAIIQPIFNMVVFTIVFGNLAKVDSEGVPYAIFSYTALVPWTYFSNALTGATTSLVQAQGMISKVYFPRITVPLAPVIAKLLDFAIAMVVLFGLMLWYQIWPTWNALFLPALVVLMILTAAGMGLLLTALSVQYRDVNLAMGFVVQLLMYAAPVVYPTSSVPEWFLPVYALNPMVGVIEGFRAALLGTTAMPWGIIGIGTLSALVIAICGLWFFKKMEHTFADVV